MSLAGEPFLPPSAAQTIVEMPKCNLHSHLEGSIRPETLWELAQELGIELEIPSSEVARALQVDGSERSLVDYLAKISYTYQVLKDANSLRRTAFEAAEDAARDGVVYFELRAGPVTHSTAKLSVGEVIESILTGLAEAESRFDIICRLIVSALRNHDPDINLELAHLALDFIDQGVVGFDLAGDEAGFPANQHAHAFEVAREGGLGITVHAGEAGGPDNVCYAVQDLKATRIGHGVRSIESDEMVKMLCETGVVLEVCPSSNVHTQTVRSFASHPVRELYQRDVAITIGDDDPITSRTRVSQELTLLKEQLGFSFAELKELQKNGLKASFLRERDIKDRLAGYFL